jgi:hypothetical protein
VGSASEQPKAIVVMPFDGKVDHLYNDVIKRVCNECNAFAREKPASI